METGREAGQVAGKTIKDISEQFMPAKKAFDEKQVRDAEEEAKKRAALDAMQTVPAANVPG
jgi:hypothetical protein